MNKEMIGGKYSEDELRLSNADNFRKLKATKLGLPENTSWEVLKNAEEELKRRDDSKARKLPGDASLEFIEWFDHEIKTRKNASIAGLPKETSEELLDQILIEQKRKILAKERGLPEGSSWQLIYDYDEWFKDKKGL